MNKTDLLLTSVHEYFNQDKRYLWKQVLRARGISGEKETLEKIETLNLAELYAIAILHNTSFVEGISVAHADAALYVLRTQLAKGVDDPFDNALFVQRQSDNAISWTLP